MPPPIARAARLRASIDRLADAVGAVGFGLSSPPAAARRQRRDEVFRSLRSSLLPRLADPAGPLLVVVFGPTGSGKSTIVNSLAGSEVSRAGPLRPTTQAVVVWSHHRNLARYAAAPFDGLPSGAPVVSADDHPLLVDLSLVDTPDVDSYVEAHRAETEEVLALADAAVYVTTAQRYSDAVPWELLRRLSERGMPLLVVLNRLTRRSAGALTDLAGALRREGVNAPDVIPVQEHRLRGGGRLPLAALRPVVAHLERLAEGHRAVRAASVEGALAADLTAVAHLAADVRAQADEAEALVRAALLGYRHQVEEIRSHLAAGNLVKAEVVGRWQRLVGVSDLASLVTKGAGRLRRLLAGAEPVRPEEVQRVRSEARDELADLVERRAGRAVRAAVNAWERDPAGRHLLVEDLRSADLETAERARVEIDEWLAGLVDLVRDEGKSRFRLARAASVGVNAAATVVLVAVFAHTGGITGAEVGVLAGTAAAQQTVLEHLFGKAAASRLAASARADLEERLERVLMADAVRFEAAALAAADPRAAADDLTTAAGEVARRIEGWTGG
jgi:energy-coupling factor transporter ATP-binding protein EcfA2